MKLSLALLLSSLVLLNSCASKNLVMRPNESTTGALIVEDRGNPGQLYIVVKSKLALDDTLTRLQCNIRPCMIGRVGEVYLVDQPSVD